MRDRVLTAVLPLDDAGLPHADPRVRAAAWARFDAVAPLHVRLALGTATVVLGWLLPLALCGGSLHALSPEARDALLVRVARWPLVGSLLEVVRVCACLVAFDDAALRRAVRA